MDEAKPRKPGRLKGLIHLGSDFDDPLPEKIAAAFGAEETRYLLSIPGMKESIQANLELPFEECSHSPEWSTGDQDPTDVDSL